MVYKWNGTAQEVEEEPKPARTGPLRKFDPSACGTYAGYARHLRYKVIPCEGCRAAMAAYSRSRYTKREPVTTFTADACGTWGGYQRHVKFKVTPCEACKQASREYQKQWRDSRKVA